MTFEPKKFDDIYEAMVLETKKRLPVNADFEVGSVVRTMYESFAYEIAVLYEQMHQVYLSAFVDTATSSQLDMVVAILGIQRGLPDFAEGVVTFTRDAGNEDLEIPVGTLVTTEDTEKSPKKAYKTIEAKTFPANQTEIDVKVQALERGEENIVKAEAIAIMPQPVPGVKSVINRQATEFTGKRAETDAELRQRAKAALISSGKASVIAIENALLSLPGVTQVQVKERFDQQNYGMVDIFVDGVDFTNEARVQYLQSQIDRVRAAGVFVRLQPAMRIQIDAVFDVELDPTLKLSPIEARSLENTIQHTISTYIAELKMGEPLLFTQLTKRVLSITGVNNLEEFAIATHPKLNAAIPIYTSQSKKIAVQESQKFRPREIRVTTSRPRPLLVKIQFQSTEKLDSNKYQELKNSLEEYFKTLKPGDAVSHQQITQRLEDKFTNLKLVADIWSPFANTNNEDINVSFVEQAQLDKNIFAYDKVLQLTGGLRFIPIDSTDTINIQTEISNRIINYIDQLQPQQPIDLIELQQAAQGEDNSFTIAPFRPDDFCVVIGDKEHNRLDNHKITVQEFEKAELGNIHITTQIEKVEVKITELQLKLVIPASPNQPPSTPLNNTNPQNALTPQAISQITTTVNQAIQQAVSFDKEKAKNDLRDAVIKVINKFPLPKTGENLNYEQLRQTLLTPLNTPEIQAILQGQASYIVEKLKITATSNSDRRQQTSTAQDIHIRSFETITTIQPPTKDKIIIN